MELISEKTCCFTGHRNIPLRESLLVRSRLREEILRLADSGVDTFLAGGALGFDTLAAQVVLRLRKEVLPGVRLVLVLPCLGQESRWREWDIRTYRALLEQADEVIYTGDVYTRGCMFTRNRYLVDHSAHCLCYLAEGAEKGGTAYTVEYAGKCGLHIVNLAEILEDPEPEDPPVTPEKKG